METSNSDFEICLDLNPQINIKSEIALLNNTKVTSPIIKELALVNRRGLWHSINWTLW